MTQRNQNVKCQTVRVILCQLLCLLYSQVCTSHIYNSPSCSTLQILDSFSYTCRCSVQEEVYPQDCMAAHHRTPMCHSGHVGYIGMRIEGENSAEGVFFSDWTWTAGMFERDPRNHSKCTKPNRKHLAEKILQAPCKCLS